MCGRFALALSHREIRDGLARDRTFDEELEEWIDEDRFHPRFNIAPRSHAPVIRRRTYESRRSTSAPEPEGVTAAPSEPEPYEAPAEALSDSAGEPELPEPAHAPLVLHTMKWGVVPHWSKYEDTTLNTTNARSENLVAGGGMWNSMKGRKRCVVVCQGYYEWLKKGRDKIPHFTRHKEPERLLLLAGLYDCVVLTGETEPLYTFAIVTTDAAKDFAWLHDRQPVILANKKAVDMWLDTGDTTPTSAQSPASTSHSAAKSPAQKTGASQKNGGWTDALTELVKPYRENKAHPLDCYQVPKEVGKVGTESETFIHPVKDRKDGIEAMFGRMRKGERATDVTVPAFGVKGEASSGVSKSKESSPDTSSPKESSAKGNSPNGGVGKSTGSEGKEREKKESQRAANLNSNLSSASPSPDPPPGPGESSLKSKSKAGKKRKRDSRSRVSPASKDEDDSEVEIIDVDNPSDPRVPSTPKSKSKQKPSKRRTASKQDSPTRSPGKKQKVVIDVDAEPSKKITKFFGKK